MDEDTETAPQVIVKIDDAVELPELGPQDSLSVDDLLSHAGKDDDDAAQAVRAAGQNITFVPAIVSVTSSDIKDLATQAAEQDADYNAPKFNNFLAVVCNEGVDAGNVADALNAWSGIVEYAYVMEIASDANVVGTGNPFFDASRQDYLAAAPDGINAKAAWLSGADGSGIGFIDIEQGWFLTHEDLPQAISLLQGTNRKTSFAHGTAVLGEIIAVDNQTGIVGIAPEASARVLSYNDDLTSSINLQRVADRVLSAAKALPFGNVMLLEIQITGSVGGANTQLPVETDPLVFEAIKLATKAGVIVVEAGGNGAADLDAFLINKGPHNGQHTLSRSNASEFQDSGAIIVGAAVSATPHGRASFSNFGSRIDCYAWGENIVTSGWDKDKPTETNKYWGVNLLDDAGQPKFFGGTSGASPIIVGCCLLLQHLRTLLTPKSGSGKLGPFAARQCLSNPANGTASAQVSDMIGSMPDFSKIIANEFQP